MKNNNVKNSIILTLCAVTLFSLGLFAGLCINNNEPINLQGFLFNKLPNRGMATNSNATTSNATTSNATTSNATTSNATTSNATTSNATTSNATTANATSANASLYDDILFLNTYYFEEDEAQAGENVEFFIGTNGAVSIGATVVITNDNDLSYSLTVKNYGSSHPYITIPSNAMSGTYTVTSIFLVGRNSNGRTFTKTVYPYNKTETLTIINDNSKNEEEKDYKLTSLKLNDTKAKRGEKVYLSIEASDPIKELKIELTSKSKKTTNLSVKDLNTKIPYIEIPAPLNVDTYELTKAVVSFEKATKIYTKTGQNNTEKFNFNSTIEIVKEEKETYIYNNDDINDETLSKIYNAPAKTNISINADSDSFIKKEVFEAIKGNDKNLIINYKNNQVLYNGREITKPKTIDTSITVEKIENTEAISKLVKSGIVINFPDNGDLPGKATIRIKATDELDDILSNNGYVYFYNQADNNFTEVNSNYVRTDDGYYRFDIDHNSDYLLVNKKLSSKLVTTSSTVDGVNFVKSNRVYVLLIVIGLLVIIGVTVFIIIMKKKQNKKKK